MKFNPPQAQAYWSCLPIGSFKSSISTLQATEATSYLSMYLSVYTLQRLINPQVKAEEEAKPVPDGISALELKSTPLILYLEKTVLIIGC